MDASGDITDFGARVFDANFPVFLSRDPMESKFSFQSSYVFASNTPIQAVDINGESSFFVMGTGYNLKDNGDPNLRETVDYLHSKLSTSTGKVNYGFDWSNRNGLTNDVNDWLIAGEELGEYALQNNKAGDDITFIGYSYGGAVAIAAADYIYTKTNGKVKVNIITIATPANNKKISVDFSHWENSSDPYYSEQYKTLKRLTTGNPQVTSGINDMIHFYLIEDGVAGGIAYDDYYTSSKVDNYVLLSAEGNWWFSNIFSSFTYQVTSHMNVIKDKSIFKKTIELNKIGKMEKVGNDDSGKTK